MPRFVPGVTFLAGLVGHAASIHICPLGAELFAGVGVCCLTADTAVAHRPGSQPRRA